MPAALVRGSRVSTIIVSVCGGPVRSALLGITLPCASVATAVSSPITRRLIRLAPSHLVGKFWSGMAITSVGVGAAAVPLAGVAVGVPTITGAASSQLLTDLP